MSALDLAIVETVTRAHLEFVTTRLRQSRSLEEFEPLGSIREHLEAILEDIEDLKQSGCA